MIIYQEFLQVLNDSNNLDEFKEYLRDHYIEILSSDYIDYMSNDFSNKYQYYCGSLESLINNL